jgi:putative ATP-binding cassette transporter
MKLLYTFLRESKGVVTIAVITAFLSGITSTAVLAVVNNGLNGGLETAGWSLWAFVGLCLAVIVTQLVSELVLLRLSEGTAFDLLVKMVNKILNTPLRSLEKLGPHRLLATLNSDLRAVSQAVTLAPLLCLYTAIILACLGYMAYLNWQMFLCLLVFFALTLALYQGAAMRGEKQFELSRDDRDTLYGSLRGLTEGTKELKLNAHRRKAFIEHLLVVPAESVRRRNVAGYLSYRIAGIFGRIAFLAVLGLLLFAAPKFFTDDKAVINGYMLAILYLNMPLTGLLNTLPTLGSARVAMRKINELGLSLTADDLPGEMLALPEPKLALESVGLSAATHRYRRESESGEFVLGPIDLEVRPGEVVFIVGGNGSGKTTLAKLLVGLYLPESGDLLWNGKPVLEVGLDSFRNNFSMVFSDFYVFDRLLGSFGADLDARAQHYLKVLQLDQKVQVKDGVLSTTALSQGQRKRLALLNAYLEDRSVYVFDEWAADQDPSFKKVFYHELLPELRQRGKAVVVISHDDHYYDVADQIVKLDYGKIDADTTFVARAGVRTS